MQGGRSITQAEARRLARENRALQAQLIELSRAYQQYLRQDAVKQYLYGRMRDFPCELIAARVVGAESLPYGRTRALNVGAAAGATPGARVTTRRLLTDRAKSIHAGYAGVAWEKDLPRRRAAVASTVLAGMIDASGAFTARLMLVTDREFAIAADLFRVIDPDNPRQVTVTREGVAALEPLTPANRDLIPVWARGDGRGGMIVEEVSRNDNVLPGDWLLTRRDDAFLPAGLPIAEVIEVLDDPEHAGFVTLRLRPLADLASLREVYVVVPLTGLEGNGDD